MALLLDKFHEDLNRVLRKPYIEEKDYDPKETEEAYYQTCSYNFKQRNDSVIVDLFYGKFRAVTVCPDCSYKSLRFDPFNMLSVPITGLSDSRDVTVYVHLELSLYNIFKVDLRASASDTFDTVKTCLAEKYNVQPASLCFLEYNRQTAKYMPAECGEKTLGSYGRKDHTFLFLVQDAEANAAREDLVAVHFEVKGVDREETVGVTKRFHFKAQSRLEDLYLFVHRCLREAYPKYVEDFECYFRPDAARLPELFELQRGTETFKYALHSAMTLELRRDELILIDILDFDLKRKQKLRELSIEPTTVQLKVTSIYDCLDGFLQSSSLDEENKWRCPKCKEHKRAEMHLSIRDSPAVLVIHLKRFKKTEQGYSKYTGRVEFPVTGLDLGRYVHSAEGYRPVLYDLYATINHMGTITKGHYVSKARNPHNNFWVEFDDDDLRKIKEQDLQGETPYILFYKKQ